MKKLYIATIALLPVCNMYGQSPVLVKDINASGSSYSRDFIEYNGKTYFSAEDGINGSELWVTDGTAAGTSMVKDVNPGADPSNIREKYILNGKMIFAASTATSGIELWTSDGTESGTVNLKDIYPGAGDANPGFLAIQKNLKYELATLGNKAFFFADDGVNGMELWVTDGTTDGTQLLKDINPGPNGSVDISTGARCIIYEGKIYFTAITTANGSELWVTDGTSAGTTLFKEINPGIDDGRPNFYTLFKGKFYFTAENVTNGAELWVSDGTTAGTTLFKDMAPGSDHSNPGNYVVMGDKMLFTAITTAEGRELWSTDGTSLGTQIVKDLNPGGNDGLTGSIYVMNASAAYFVGTINAAGNSLYKTDVTESGTVPVHAFDNDQTTSGWFSPIAYNNKLYFQISRTTEGWQLWNTDGTDTGTKIIAPDIAPNFNPLATSRLMNVCNDMLFYTGDYTTIGEELYKIKDEVTGIEDAPYRSGIRLYPNPVSDVVTIQGAGIGTSAVGYNMAGQQVWETLITKDRQAVDLSGIPAGVYIIHFTGADGSKGSVRMVKQ